MVDIFEIFSHMREYTMNALIPKTPEQNGVAKWMTLKMVCSMLKIGLRHCPQLCTLEIEATQKLSKVWPPLRHGQRKAASPCFWMWCITKKWKEEAWCQSKKVYYGEETKVDYMTQHEAKIEIWCSMKISVMHRMIPQKSRVWKSDFLYEEQSPELNSKPAAVESESNNPTPAEPAVEPT